MSALWTTVAASLISSTAALTGVWFSNRDHLRRHRETLGEEALKGQRHLVADVLLAGREWHGIEEFLLPARFKMSMDELMEFSNTDSARRRYEVNKDLQVALTRANLFLADDKLRTVVKTLSGFIDTFAEAVVGPILKEPRDFEAVVAGIRAVTGFRNTLRQLEELLSAALVGDAEGA
jgi:hypothetical protein